MYIAEVAVVVVVVLVVQKNTYRDETILLGWVSIQLKLLLLSSCWCPRYRQSAVLVLIVVLIVAVAVVLVSPTEEIVQHTAQQRQLIHTIPQL